MLITEESMGGTNLVICYQLDGHMAALFYSQKLHLEKRPLEHCILDEIVVSLLMIYPLPQEYNHGKRNKRNTV